MQLPGKNVLVLAAVCLSIIGGVSAYKIAQSARLKMAETTEGGIVASNIATVPASTNKLLNALQEIELTSGNTTSTNPFAPSANDTLTDRLSKNFFSSYAKTQGSDSSELPDDETLINNALSTVDTSKMPKEKYTTSDMKIVAGNTKEELRAYGNAFAKIQYEGLLPIRQNPSVYQNDLSSIGTVYAPIAARLIKIPVPVAIAAEHLAIVNGFYISSEDFKLIDEQSKDPMKSLLGLRQYKDTVERQTRMYTDIANYFKSNGILFTDTEPGFFWTELTETDSSR